jgi:putative ABC transport system substrate-binding protein
MRYARLAILAAPVLAIVAAPLAAEAQPAAKVATIGYLGNSSAASESHLVGAFRQGLHDLGYTEGQNILIEYRWADGKYDRLPEFAAEMVRRKVDVILTVGTPGALAAEGATHTIPIVMASAGDPVAAGLVTSLARPGGNITGLNANSPEANGKRVELLKEILPQLSRIAVLMNPANPVTAVHWRATQAAADTLRLKIEPVEVKTVEGFEPAFAAVTKHRPGALLMLSDRILLAEQGRILGFAARQRLPAVYPYREFVDASGLMSYSPTFPDMFRRAATFVDKILKGARPGDLPIEQPAIFELVINLKTAKALGLTIPPAVLARADDVIE